MLRGPIIAGLDGTHSALLRAFAERPSWTRGEWEALGTSVEMLPAGSLDTVNGTLDRNGEPLAEGDEPNHGRAPLGPRASTPSQQTASADDRRHEGTATPRPVARPPLDVGQVRSVAQIGAPPSVASLRQRLGRSGRRGEPAILRMYVTEEELAGDPSPQDALRAELVQAVATVRLLLRGWYEPPAAGMLHLSTLLQQVLSLVAQHGGVSAARAWEALCRGGPFSNVGQAMFGELLRSMGRHDLIAQMHDGVLVLGLAGERLVNHHTFYAVFVTPEEYRLTSGGKALGTLPITFPVYPEMFLIFGGRRWKVVSVDCDRKVLDLVRAPGGRVPFFGSTGGAVHDGVRKEMYRVYTSTEPISFLDARAADLLREGRENFDRYDLARRAVVPYGSEVLLFLWVGDRALNTIQVQLQARGLTVTRMGLGLAVSGVRPEGMAQHLRALVEAGPANPLELAATVRNKTANKYDEFLPDALLDADHAARAFDPAGAWEALEAVVRGASGDG